MSSHRHLDLASLPSFQCPGLTPALATVFVEAGTVCLNHHRHPSKTVLNVQGHSNCAFMVSWKIPTEQIEKAHDDLQEATERGATCVALHLARELLQLHVAQRSRKGGGFDYWLCPVSQAPNLFQNTTRLEVSGILSGDASAVRSRLQEKRDQIQRSSGTPSCVVIVEFGGPGAYLSQ